MKCLWIGSCWLALHLAASAQAGSDPARDPRRWRAGDDRRDLALIENRGQWDSDAHFVAWLPDLVVLAEPHALGLQIPDAEGTGFGGTYLRLRFEGASAGVTLIPERPGRALHSWFLGNDPTQWRTGLREHGALRWHGLYAGIDLVLHADGGLVKYDLEVAAGADLSQVRIRCEGAERIEIDAQGFLAIAGARGCFSQAPAVSFQRSNDGRLSPIEVRYRSIDERTFGFMVGARDPQAALWIDPSLDWSTYFGGPSGPSAGLERATSVDVDPAGSVYVTGEMQSLAFPTTPGTYQHPSSNGDDCFAAKFDSNGHLVYSSVFGGSHIQERAQGIRVDREGRAIVAGTTFSNDFPSTPGAFEATYDSVAEAGFVLQLSRNGDRLLWSTFLRGSSTGDITDLALDAQDSPIVVGSTSNGFPVTPGAYDVIGDSEAADGFITKFDPTGSRLEWSTFLGGVFSDFPLAVEVDEQGFVTVVGMTNSVNFPTTPGAYATTYMGGTSQPNVFVTRLTPAGDSLVWSTFLGGMAPDGARGMALVSDGGVVVAGATSSLNFPVTHGVLGPDYTGGFVTRFNASGSALVYSTFVGAPGLLPLFDVTVDRSGIATVVGQTQGGSPATAGAFDTTLNGNLDVMVLRISPSADKLYYSTYVGGAGNDEPEAIVGISDDRLTVVGSTGSPNYPTTPGAFDSGANGGGDAFITTFRPFLQGVEPHGSSTDSCHGPLIANATEMPRAAASTFGLYLSGAPALSQGLCFVATAPSSSGAAFGSATLWIAPDSIVRRIPVTTDALGFVETPLPIGTLAAGAQLWAQFVIRNAQDCTSGGRLVASNAVHVTVQ